MPISSQAQLGHIALESTFGVAVAPTNSNAFKVVSLQTTPDQPLRDRPDKNVALGNTVGIGGMKTGAWSTRVLGVGSSAAGTAPDHGPLLQLAMGAVPIVVASTSVRYNLGSNIYSASIWNLWDPADATQYVSIGSVVASFTIDLSGEDPFFEFGGPSKWVLDTDQFADADTGAKGGLVSFPAKPNAPVTNGNQIPLTAGSATFDGDVLTGIRSFRLTAAYGRDIPNDIKFSGYYGIAPGQDRRTVTFDLNVYDKNGDVDFSTLKSKATRKVPIDVTIVAGSVAGHILEIPIKNVILGTPQIDDGQRNKAISFSGCRAHMSSTSANDEFAVICR